MELFILFLSIYTVLGLSYVWFQYTILLSSRVIKYPEQNMPISIIVPAYNEDKVLFTHCINSILNTKYTGKKEIIIVDDGSTNNTFDIAQSYQKKYPGLVRAFKLPKNLGKRKAQARGVLESKGEIIITVDSDTILHNNALIEIVKPFSDPKIGAVCGNILILNKNENWLTKFTSSMYWGAFNMGRKIHGSLNFMQVCSGALGAYRKDGLLKLLPKYVTQSFYGKPVKIGDDRYLTQRFQTKLRYNIAFAKEAIAWTDSPSSFKKYFIQLLRWRRSTIFESLYLILEFPKAILLFMDSWFEIVMTTLGVFIRVYFFWLMITGRMSILSFLLSILFVAVVNNSYILFFKKNYILNRIGYTFLNETILWVIHPIALFTVRKQGTWSSR